MRTKCYNKKCENWFKGDHTVVFKKLEVRYVNTENNCVEYADVKECPNLKLKEEENIKMVEEIKKTAKSMSEIVEPYKKYVGLVAISLVIDHFLLGDKFTYRFLKMAESIVSKVADSLDALIQKIDFQCVDKENIGESEDQ